MRHSPHVRDPVPHAFLTNAVAVVSIGKPIVTAKFLSPSFSQRCMIFAGVPPAATKCLRCDASRPSGENHTLGSRGRRLDSARSRRSRRCRRRSLHLQPSPFGLTRHLFLDGVAVAERHGDELPDDALLDGEAVKPRLARRDQVSWGSQCRPFRQASPETALILPAATLIATGKSSPHNGPSL